MSRLFDDALTEYLTHAAAVKNAVPIAMVCWFKSDDDAVNQVLISLTDISSNNHVFTLQIRGDVGGDPIYAIQRNGTTWNYAETSSGYTTGTWHHACALFVSATDRRVLIDNGGKGTNATSNTPSSAAIDTTSIGAMVRLGGDSSHMSGYIAEAAIYDLSAYPGATDALKADYFEANVLPALAGNETPADYTTGLLAYWSFLTSSLDDEHGEFDLTAEGTEFSTDHPPVGVTLSGSVAGVSGVTGNLKSVEKIKVLVEAQSALTGNLRCLQELAGLIEVQSGVTGNLQWLKELAGLIEAQSGVTGNVNSTLVYSLAGSLAGLSSVTGNILSTETLVGSLAGISSVDGNLQHLMTLAGSLTGISSVAGNLKWLQELAGLIEAQSVVTGELTSRFTDIPPFMEKDLIDPYSSGAWLWLAEIAVPTKDTVRIARNTEDVPYDGNNFEKHNIQIGEQVFSGDGSIPRITLRTFQDSTRQIENIINETEGALGGAVRLIRVNEKWLTSPVSALEADYDLLASQSDSEWCTITLGIPNPLTQRYPLRDFSSSICPWTSPKLYKGPECKCVHADATCTGTYDDCLSKGNETRWGGELGLSPSVVKESRL